MNVIEVNKVSKAYKDFFIDDMNFTVPEGFITGFIGPNGSGKSTTMQMIMDVVKPDHGDIYLFGEQNEVASNKQKIGFVYDELFMYENFHIKKMKSIIAPLYDTWDDNLFEKYINAFELPLKKKIKHFSKGMKMKCSLLFALSHNPEVIIMDEPTSGLDPIFRRELLDILQELMINEKRSIFFSTHITTDLDKIADHIVFIYNGKVVFQKSMTEIEEQYHLIKGKNEWVDTDTRDLFLGMTESSHGFTALFEGDVSFFDEFEGDLLVEKATLEDIMYFMTKGKRELQKK